MRLKNNYNIAKKCSGDICTILHEQSKDGTKDIDTRVIEITLPDGKKEYLATNLLISQLHRKCSANYISTAGSSPTYHH